MGINGTVFAYGQTGAGKTYSIIGGEPLEVKRGILPRTLDYIFDQLNSAANNYKLSANFYEIYNEKIYDLWRK